MELKLSPTQKTELKSRIESETREILSKIESHQTNVPLKLDDEGKDDADIASALLLHTEQLKLSNREKLQYSLLLEAAERLENDEIQHCEECDAIINFKRLLAKPTARLCISCKEEMERDNIVVGAF